MNACREFSFHVQHVFTIFLYNTVVLESQLLVHWYKMMSHLLLRQKSLVRSRNRRLCWQRPSQNTCFAGEIDLIMKWPSLFHDSSERCVSIDFFSVHSLISPGGTTPEPFITMSDDFILKNFRYNYEISSCYYHFCSSRGCLWECVTVKTRFCCLKKTLYFYPH